jgi:predicted nucleic acid-binding protein
LLSRYGQRMDYADACLVRLAELHRKHVIVTTDAEDFRIYRRFGRQALALHVP